MIQRDTALCHLLAGVYLFNINLVQQCTRKEKEEKHKNYNKTTVKTKLYIVSQPSLQRRPY